MKKANLESLCIKTTDGKHGDCEDELNSQYYFLSAKDIKNGKIFYENGRKITEKDFKDTDRRTHFEEDDILITNTGASVGRFAIAKKDSRIRRTTFQKSVSVLTVKKNLLIPDFLYYYLCAYRKEIVNLGGGSAQANLLLRDIRSYKIHLPPLPTQKKIATILSAYDELIENNNQRIQLLEEMAEEIYKEWFVRMRFPGYETCTFRDKEGKEVPHGTVGALPEGWEIQKFRSCLTHYIGGGWGEESPKGANTLAAHVIRGTDIPGFNKGNLNFEVLRFHTESNLSKRICEPNDIIFEVSGGTEDQSLGRTCFITKSALSRFNAPVIGASFCKLIRVNPNIISPYYINSLLKRMYSTNELKVFQVQSTGICNYQFEDFIDATSIKIPVTELQNQFDKIITPIMDEIQILGAKNQVLRETRDLLLPRLISGKLSVEDLEVE